jgi:hypothetical protein
MNGDRVWLERRMDGGWRGWLVRMVPIIEPRSWMEGSSLATWGLTRGLGRRTGTMEVPYFPLLRTGYYGYHEVRQVRYTPTWSGSGSGSGSVASNIQASLEWANKILVQIARWEDCLFAGLESLRTLGWESLLPFTALRGKDIGWRFRDNDI